MRLAHRPRAASYIRALRRPGMAEAEAEARTQRFPKCPKAPNPPLIMLLKGPEQG